jgi:hypothetical protein
MFGCESATQRPSLLSGQAGKPRAAKPQRDDEPSRTDRSKARNVAHRARDVSGHGHYSFQSVVAHRSRATADPSADLEVEVIELVCD